MDMPACPKNVEVIVIVFALFLALWPEFFSKCAPSQIFA
jgi:hypothetical protein